MFGFFNTDTLMWISGLEKMVKVYTEQPNFSNQKNLDETEQLLDEVMTSTQCINELVDVLSHVCSSVGRTQTWSFGGHTL